MSIIVPTASGLLSREGYVRAICFCTIVMCGVVAVGSTISYDWQFSWLFLIGTFIGAIIGIIIFCTSDDPMTSGIGVAFMSLCLGLMMGPAIAHFSGPTTLLAAVITAIVMVVMSMLGLLFPQLFSGMGPYLMAGLTLLIVAQFAQIILALLGFQEALQIPIITWFGIGLFLLFTAYDWTQAMEKEYTWNNAIDTSGSLVLDAVNLFIRILEVLGEGSAGSSGGSSWFDGDSGGGGD
jgi:FtsH-binding integral membrane protein